MCIIFYNLLFCIIELLGTSLLVLLVIYIKDDVQMFFQLRILANPADAH